jgi:lysozyme family protein
MADLELLAPILFGWEGGYQCDKEDTGNYNSKGELVGTKYGVSAKAFEVQYKKIPSANDMKNLTPDGASFVIKRYWDGCKGDLIQNQSIANILVDWYYNSGISGIKSAQKALGLNGDGIVGNVTLSVLNGSNKADIFAKIQKARLQFVNNIVLNRPEMGKYLSGWTNRINSFKFSN